MDNHVSSTLSNHLEIIMDRLRSGEFEEAIICAQEAQNFGLTIAPEALTQWVSQARDQLQGLMPYRSSVEIPFQGPALLLKSSFFGLDHLAAVSSVFRALNLQTDYFESAIILYSMQHISSDHWIALCDECIAGNETSLAGRCCSLAIRALAPDLSNTSQLDDTQKQWLLDLWFRRSRIFELQQRDSDAISAFQIYARLLSEFQLQSSTKRQMYAKSKPEDPASYRARQRLLARRKSRLNSR